MLALLLSAFLFAQNPFKEKVPVLPGTSSRSGMLDVPRNSELSTPSYGKFTDEHLKELEDDMNERSWGSEDTAWQRARTLDSEDSYKKFIAMYPYSAHRGEADKRIIDLRVDDALRNAHSDLPGITRTDADDESPTSSVTVVNHTEYALTVLFSGDESRSVVISPGRSAVVKVNNGSYKLAASVPPPHIRPFAGTTDLSGGGYEIGFWVVSTYSNSF